MRFFLVALIFAGSFTELTAQSQEEVERALGIAYELLDRTVKGKAPCFTRECQAEKSKLLHEINRQGNVLLFVKEDFQEHLQDGVYAGRQLSNSNSINLLGEVREPRGIRDWMRFYELRLSYQFDYEQDWIGLANIVELLKLTIPLYLHLDRRLTPGDRKFFQDIWNKGYVQALADHRLSQELMAKRDEARARGRSAEAERLHEEAIRLQIRGRDWRREHQVSIRDAQRRIFPQFSMSRITDICLIFQTWMDMAGVSEIFDPRLENTLALLNKSLDRLHQSVQSFDDLEYGIVGLENFLSLTNPAIRAAQEHAIQIELEEHISTARYIVNTGQSTFAYVTALAMGGSSKLFMFGLLGASNYLQDVVEVKVSDTIFPTSNRIHSLEESYAYWEPRMLKRKEELEKTKLILEEKIQHLESLLDQQQTEGTNNGEEESP